MRPPIKVYILFQGYPNKSMHCPEKKPGFILEDLNVTIFIKAVSVNRHSSQENWLMTR